jgi:hypothetical protein
VPFSRFAQFRIDDPVVRRQLQAEFRISDSLKLERGGGIYAVDNTNPVQYTVKYGTVANPPATQCWNSFSVGGQAGLTLVAIWHTHPNIPGQTFSNCPSAPPTHVAGRGPSTQDYLTQESLQPQVPSIEHFIIDPNDVFRVVAHADKRSRWGATRSMSWRRCQGWSTLPPS